MSVTVDLKTSSFEPDFGSMVYLCDASTYSMTISLPDVSGDSSWNGTHCYIKRIDDVVAKSVTIDCYDNQMIDGQYSLSLTPNYSVHIMAYNGGWLVLSNN
jgi:hypothetical protein